MRDQHTSEERRPRVALTGAGGGLKYGSVWFTTSPKELATSPQIPRGPKAVVTLRKGQMIRWRDL